ncbi:MAG: AMP-dependent synthetase [Aeromicrobium sp.]|nr:AMP-dependent synthetase [Aeromicrobium sp.]
MDPSLTLRVAGHVWLSRGVTVNVSDYLRTAAERDPDGTALIEHRPARRAVTWRELDSAADSVARALSGRGLVAGHRVALVMANRIDLPIAYYGILRGGMVAVPINPRSTTREIGRMLADSRARIVLCDEAGVAQVREAVTGEHAVGIVVDGAEPRAGETSFERFLADATGTPPAAPADAEALAVILYTSGTSGKPRGAMLTHRALIANTEQIARLEPPAMSPQDVCLGLLPMFHIYGLNCVLGQAVRQGATVVMVDGFDAVGLLDLIVAEGITNLPLAPPVIAAWAGRGDLREKLAGVTTILSGASALEAALAESFSDSSGHRIEQGYGLTETAPVISTTHGSPRDARNLLKHGSVGRPLPGIELRVVEAGGAAAAPGDPAEIWVRGDNLFSGYWPDGADGPGPDGWYPTGDIGFVDADGDLTLVDRLRELVIVSGFNVYPFEVEDVIAEVPGVAQVAVVGLPDEETGEAVLAFIVPAKDSLDDEQTLVERVEAHCRTRLARFKQPRRTLVVTGLPHSATGKVAKGRLRALARSETLGLGTS